MGEVHHDHCSDINVFYSELFLEIEFFDWSMAADEISSANNNVSLPFDNIASAIVAHVIAVAFHFVENWIAA